MKGFTRACGAIEKACCRFCVVLLAGITLLTFFEAVLRYGFDSSFQITQELVKFAMPWLAFVGGAAAWRRNELVSIDVLAKVPKPIKAVCTILCQTLIIALLYLSVKSGMRYVLKNIVQISPSMRISMAYCYASIPLGCALMLLFSIEKVLKLFVKEDRGADEPGKE